MLIEQLTIIKEVGLGIAGLAALFYILTMVLTWSHKQAEKTLKLAEDTSERILKLAEDTISKNTQALQHMQELIIQNMKSKDQLVSAIENQTDTISTKLQDCKRGRDQQLQKIIDISKKH